MLSQNTEGCASCGAAAAEVCGVVACASRSWFQAKGAWLVEDVRAWQIRVCDDCRRRHYASSLAERRTVARQSLVRSPLEFAVFAVIAVAMWLAVPPLRPWLHENPTASKILTILFAFTAFFAIIALLRIPVFAIQLLIAGRRLRAHETTHTLPVTAQVQVAEVAARGLLASLEAGGGTTRPGFDLPKFKNSEELPEDFRGATPSGRERTICAGAESLEKLRARLVPAERELLAAWASAPQ